MFAVIAIASLAVIGFSGTAFVSTKREQLREATWRRIENFRAMLAAIDKRRRLQREAKALEADVARYDHLAVFARRLRAVDRLNEVVTAMIAAGDEIRRRRRNARSLRRAWRTKRAALAFLI
jgi:hypothetical protein